MSVGLGGRSIFIILFLLYFLDFFWPLLLYSFPLLFFIKSTQGWIAKAIHHSFDGRSDFVVKPTYTLK
jgi:hypothetical protein